MLTDSVTTYELQPDLGQVKRWCLWKELPASAPGKKPRKVPFYANGKPRGGELDSAEDLAQLVSFDTARRVLARGGYTGLGFALGPDGNGGCYQGIDLDGLSHNHHLAPLALTLPSYTERSPGGDGIHALGYGKHYDALGDNGSGVEAYSSGRYFTFTANVVSARPLSDLSGFVAERLLPVHRSMAASQARQQQPPQSPQESTPHNDVDWPALRSALFYLDANDRHTWQQAGHALKTLGDAGLALWLEWSATSPKHDPVADRRTWAGFRPQRTSWKAILANAQMTGWQNPASKNAQPADKGGGEKPTGFDQFSLNGSSSEMEAAMLEEVYVLDKLAILGQSTHIFSKPNAGKTLLTLWQIIESIENGTIDGHDLFYVNADDTHRGLTFKLKMAEQYGFKMLAPGYRGFRAEMLAGVLAGMIADGTAHGKILVLDTAKKFTDIMDKAKSSKFGEAVRQFVSAGGTVITLGHVNKHRDGSGKVIHGGTSDFVDDCDCAYTLDIVTDRNDGARAVLFENLKMRGDVATEMAFTYDASGGLDYQQRLDSVRRLSDAEQSDAEETRRAEEAFARNRAACEALHEALRAGIALKTDLIHAAKESSGLSRRQIVRALSEHTGKDVSRNQFWTVGKGEKNAAIYRLNLG